MGQQEHASQLENKHKFAYMQPAIDAFTVTITENANDQFELEMEKFNEMKDQTIDEKKKQLKSEFKENKMNEWDGKLAFARDLIRQEEERIEREARDAKRREQQAAAEKQREQEERLENERRRKRDQMLAEK